MSQNQNLKLVRKTLRHMEGMSAGHQHGGLLLAGDPGIGKTTFVNMLGSLLGMRTITIEVPHITEEHLINIPFIVFDANTNQTQSQASKMKMASEYSMILADSNLYTQLTSAPIMDDAAYLKHIQTAPAVVQQIYMAMGGTAEQMPHEIEAARKNHKVILFLDEFYRSTTIRIRNIMRGMLNGNIGKHKIPGNVYTLYASNMEDTGIDETPGNAQFTMVQYKAAKADDWFDWLVAKYETDTHIKLREDVIEKFKAALKDEDMSHTDVNSAVRTSPRRWEQLLTYINAAIPASDVTKARALVTNVRNNFLHYQSGQYSKLADKVVAAVVELIKNTSGINITPADELDDHDWRISLAHHVEMQMKTGNKRKHIPVVSGPPGIGKTSQAEIIAAEHNMRLIEIDVGELYADDAIGMPIPGGKADDGSMSVRFSVPKLYQKIMSEIENKDKSYLESLSRLDPAEAKAKAAQYNKQEYKYLIFFDELNRVDEKTFNAMRRVVLEKDFGEADGKMLKLPKEAIVVAAINPEGVGTTELTEHFRDVIDVIPSKGSWTYLKRFLMNKKYKYPDEMKDVSWSILEAFTKKFKSKDTRFKPEQAPFHLDIGGGEVYIAPREYTDMFSTLVREVGAAIKEGLDDPNIKENQMRDLVDVAIADALEDTLNFPLKKAGLEAHEFLATLRQWVDKLPDSLFGAMLSKKAKNVDSLGNTLTKYLDGHDLAHMPEDHHIVNANNVSNDSQVIDEIKEALHSRIKDDASVQKYILDLSHPRATLKDEKITFDASNPVSHLENLFLSLLYALHIHQYAHNRINVVCKSLSGMMSDLQKTLVKEKKISKDVADDASMAVVELRGQLLEVVQDL